MKKSSKADTLTMGILVRDFFHWMVQERNVSPNTVAAYRDALVLFLRHLADTSGRTVDQLTFDEDMADHVLVFLNHLEQTRSVSISTRNHRLSAIKSFCRYVAYAQPLLASTCRRVTLLPLKKRTENLVEYLEAEEMEAIIDTADRHTVEGSRDHALLLMMFNTGCRVSELIRMERDDILIGPPPYIRILGKGRRWRTVPLWKRTMKAVENLLPNLKSGGSHLFIGQRGEPLTRSGVRHLIERRCKMAAEAIPALKKKRISPHTIRHTTAVALLRATGDIDGVAKILGHSSLNTTRLYTAADRSRLADTLNSISSALIPGHNNDWVPDAELLTWLENL